MNEETARFVDAMYGGLEGYVYGTTSKERGDWKQFYFSWPDDREKLLEWSEAWTPHKNVFLAPSLFSDRRSTKEHWKCTNYLWAEFDGNYNADKFGPIPKPHIIVQSSGAGYMHCYWKIHPSEDWEEVEDYNRRLARYLGADYSGFDCNQVLRPPGTHNHKPGKDVPVREILNPDFKIPHPVGWFDGLPEVKRLSVVPDLEDSLLPVSYIFEKYAALPGAIDRIVVGMQKSENPDRSDALMRLAYTCAEWGMEYAEIMSVLVEGDQTIQKFVGRSDKWIRYQECVEVALNKHPTGILAGFVLIENEEVGDEVDPFSFIGVTDLAAKEIKIEWAWKDFLPTTGLLLLSGAPGVGKSQLTLDAMYRMALQESYLGYPMERPIKVGMISLEMGEMGLHSISVRQQGGLSQESRRILNERVLISALGEPLDLTNPKNQAALIKQIKAQEFTGIVVDALSSTTLESLSDEKTAKAVLGWLAHLRQSLGIFVWLIHHNRKATSGNERPNKLADVHGAVYIAGVADTVLILWKNEKGQLELIPVKSRYSGLDSGEHIFKLTRTANLTFQHELVKPGGIEVKNVGKTLGFNA